MKWTKPSVSGLLLCCLACNEPVERKQTIGCVHDIAVAHTGRQGIKTKAFFHFQVGDSTYSTTYLPSWRAKHPATYGIGDSVLVSYNVSDPTDAVIIKITEKGTYILLD